MSSSPPVIVVGAGIGGLCSAIALASRGVPVLILERASQSGGKIRQESVLGRTTDAGPTVLTMRWVFDELFDQAHHSFDAHVRLIRASRLARHFWQGGARLDLFSDLEQSIEAVGTFAGAKEAEGYRRFADHTAKVHATVRDVFLRSDRPSFASTLSALKEVGLPALWRVEGHRTMWNALGDYFHDPRLRQLFARYATYAGSSPFLSPATLNVIAHVEREGVWLPEGGMRSVADACERVARRLGVVFRYGTEVERLVVGTRGVEGVRTNEGETIASSSVVFNGDPAAIASGLLGDRVRKAASFPKHRSLSAVTTCAVAPVQEFDIDYHTVFFSDDYAREFIELFHQMVVPSRPTVYVCAQDRAGFGTADGPNERLFFLINAPATGDSCDTEFSSCQTSMIETLRRCGWEPEFEPGSVVTTPAEFAARFPATGGSLYGAASHGMLSPLSKAPARSKIPGLYFAGGGAHPGAGVPMAATSGVLAARAILADFASTRRSFPMAIDGGTSTSSATTAPLPSS